MSEAIARSSFYYRSDIDLFSIERIKFFCGNRYCSSVTSFSLVSIRSHFVITLMCGSSSDVMELRAHMVPDKNLLASSTKRASIR